MKHIFTIQIQTDEHTVKLVDVEIANSERYNHNELTNLAKAMSTTQKDSEPTIVSMVKVR